ncbi:MAG: transketolase family protein [Dehalococcoidia bacterium]
MVEKISTRESVGQFLADSGEEFKDLVILGGDLNKSTFSNIFGSKFPDRFFDFGPAEQNIVSVAAGMASTGKIPVISTFAVFATSRPYDQLRVGVSQSNLNVKIIATHAGILTGEDGVSAQSIEDIAIMSALHNFKVIVPSDAIEALQATRVAIESDGPFYIRLSRPATPVVNKEDYKFVLGKGSKLNEGNDATIIACGIMVSYALEAAKSLEDVGINCSVINMATVSPIDTGIIINSAKNTGAIVTAEEHYISGGLSSLVSQVLSTNIPVPMESVALTSYAESGKPEDLFQKYGLTSEKIFQAVKKVIDRKTSL